MRAMAILILTGFVVTAEATPACAVGGGQGRDGGSSWNGGGERRARQLMKLDSNKDGVISREEFLAPRKSAFQTLDADKNGAVAPAEIKSPMDEKSNFKARRFMKRHDGNNDGKITLEEFQAAPKERFRERDLNNDGKIDADERGGRKNSWWSGFAGAGKAKGEGRGQREQTLDKMLERTATEFKSMDANGDAAVEAAEVDAAMTHRAEDSVKRTMHRQDKDNDGRITEAEFMAKTDKRFVILDIDSDGKITPSDLPPDERRFLKDRQ